MEVWRWRRFEGNSLDSTHWTRYFIYTLSFNPHNSSVKWVINSILQMKKTETQKSWCHSNWGVELGLRSWLIHRKRLIKIMSMLESVLEDLVFTPDNQALNNRILVEVIYCFCSLIWDILRPQGKIKPRMRVT